MLKSLDHLVIAVRDLETATATYTRLLGRRPSWRGTHPTYGTANSLFRLGNAYLELLGSAGGEAWMLDGWLEEHGEGPYALAFGTADANACAAALRARGVAATEPLDGEGRDSATGAVRRWRNVFLPADATRGVQLFAIEHRSAADALPLAEPTEDSRAAVEGFDHVVITSGDPEATKQVYGDLLGLRLALDRTFEQWGARLLFFRVGGITVEIAAGSGAAGPPEHPGPGSAGTDRIWGISWRVPDLDRARERLARDGFDASEVRSGRRPGTRVLTVRSGTHGVATLFLGPA